MPLPTELLAIFQSQFFFYYFVVCFSGLPSALFFHFTSPRERSRCLPRAESFPYTFTRLPHLKGTAAPSLWEIVLGVNQQQFTFTADSLHDSAGSPISSVQRDVCLNFKSAQHLASLRASSLRRSLPSNLLYTYVNMWRRRRSSLKLKYSGKLVFFIFTAELVDYHNTYAAVFLEFY